MPLRTSAVSEAERRDIEDEWNKGEPYFHFKRNEQFDKSLIMAVYFSQNAHTVYQISQVLVEMDFVSLKPSRRMKSGQESQELASAI